MAARSDNFTAVSRQIFEMFTADSAYMQSTAFKRKRSRKFLRWLQISIVSKAIQLWKNVYFELFRCPKCFHSESLSLFQKSQSREPRRYDFIVELKPIRRKLSNKIIVKHACSKSREKNVNYALLSWCSRSLLNGIQTTDMGFNVFLLMFGQAGLA